MERKINKNDLDSFLNACISVNYGENMPSWWEVSWLGAHFQFLVELLHNVFMNNIKSMLYLVTCFLMLWSYIYIYIVSTRSIYKQPSFWYLNGLYMYTSFIFTFLTLVLNKHLISAIQYLQFNNFIFNYNPPKRADLIKREGVCTKHPP